MSRAGAKRTSLILLLVLAAGLVLAGSAAAAGAQEMACCPPSVEMGAGCTWLGAGDCCPERPGAPAQPQVAPPAAAPGCEIALPAPAARLAVLPSYALLTERAPRTLVLRL